jgi:glycosyltransferase involved in cell wall biosynthesis
LVKRILSNRSWLMISNELCSLLRERYGLAPQRLLIVQNPVDLSNTARVAPIIRKNEYTLAYAGALWPMHFDSFKIIAESVFQLKKKININLILYSRKQFWDWRRAELEIFDVAYGGDIPYKNIHEKLAQADALVLTSSFLREFSSHTKGSVQTKITDYLKSQRLIISCGPTYSANHNFLRKNNCGICIETNDMLLVTEKLDIILQGIDEYQPLITNGWNLLEREYTFPKVHKKLKEFLLNEFN